MIDSGNDAGFTYVETIVALLLVSLLLIPLGLLVRAGFSVPPRIAGKGAQTRNLVLLDRELRRLASRVRPPYWLKGPQVTEDGYSLRVNWLDGEESGILNLTIEPDGLSCLELEEDATTGTPLKKLPLDGFDSARFETPAVGEGSGASRGFRLVLCAGGDETRLDCAFGGRSLFNSPPRGAWESGSE